jgi:CubicO group peptidase (beta-lactamase class C family)
LLTPQTFQDMRNDAFPGIPYGRGLFSTTLSDGTEVVGHSGGTPGWNTWMLSYPQQDATVVVLTNGVLEVNPNSLLTQAILETASLPFPFANDPAGNA